MAEIDYAARDKEFWTRMTALFERNEFSPADILRNFSTYVRRRDMVRFLAHYEIFKNVIDLPGCIVEAGVFQGASFFTWVKLMETFCPGDRSRRVYGFDHFEGLQDFDQRDGRFDDALAKHVGGYASSLANIEELVALHNADGLLPGIPRCAIVNGDIRKTLPHFLEENPGLKLAILHLDMDIYLPTKFALEHLYDHVLTGGMIVFDQYGLTPWEGETHAVDEFFAERGLVPRIHKFPFTQTPHGFMTKE